MLVHSGALSMDRIARFREAKTRLAELHRAYPEASAILSMQSQLDFLIGLESGENTDRSRLKEIILGVQTAREVEPRDEDLAKFMYEVVDEVDNMNQVS